jgi:uncharacterized protein with von Willebrand factor type A (vWA) domain
MWRERLQEKVEKYIRRDIADSWQLAFLDWWKKTGPPIMNEFEGEVERLAEGHSKLELSNLYAIIEMDGAIDKKDPNVQRVLATINRMGMELRQPIDYTQPEDDTRGVTGETDMRVVEALKGDE